MPKLKVLYIHNAPQRFVEIDRDLLKEEVELTEWEMKKSDLLKWRKLWKMLQTHDVLLAWFASWHSFFPVLFAWFTKCRSVVITGGYDSANLKECGYGNQRKWLPRTITNFILNQADLLICNSFFTAKETFENTGLTSPKVKVVHHGIEFRAIEENAPRERAKIALNVGGVFKHNLKRKGIEPFIETAKHLPDYQFIQIGKWHDQSGQELLKNLPPNAELKGFVNDQVLEQAYAEARYYIQPSLHEGFGLSVIEAMQKGCYPIVGAYGALPEVVGDFGLVLKDLKPESIAQSIQDLDLTTLPAPQTLNHYVNDRFNLENRKRGLLNVLKAVREL